MYYLLVQCCSQSNCQTDLCSNHLCHFLGSHNLVNFIMLAYTFFLSSVRSITCSYYCPKSNFWSTSKNSNFSFLLKIRTDIVYHILGKCVGWYREASTIVNLCTADGMIWLHMEQVWVEHWDDNCTSPDPNILGNTEQARYHVLYKVLYIPQKWEKSYSFMFKHKIQSIQIWLRGRSKIAHWRRR